MSDLGDIENNELIKNNIVKQRDKYKKSKKSYLGNISQNINKINNLITPQNQIIALKECLYKVEKYLHQ